MAKKAGPPRSAAPFVPRTTSVRTLGAAAQMCRGCDLYKEATQAVFGSGPRTARVMLVGEQPGDQEDRHGAPFVGPAGAVLYKALEDAGIARDTASDGRRAAYESLVADLKVAAKVAVTTAVRVAKEVRRE